MNSDTPLLEAFQIDKRFLGVHALKGVDAAFYAGEVVAVMGENGAGKSTLMKCLAGVHRPTSGEVRWEGKPVEIDSVRAAEALGIAFIHQELNLADNLSIGANIFLGREPRVVGPLGWIDRKQIWKATDALLKQLRLPHDPDTLVRDLSIGHQQLVEIAKALSQKARLIIMDEPTSSLTQHETETLLSLVESLRDEGISIVFISHRIREVEAIADRVIVLLDGENSGTLARGEIEHDRIVTLMVGREMVLHEKEASDGDGEVLLEVEGFRTAQFPHEAIDLRLRAGEVVGMAGLVGAGRTELVRALFGIDRSVGGVVRVRGEEHVFTSARQAMKAGLALVPEDRKKEGAILELSIRDNVAMASLGDTHRNGFVREGVLNRMGDEAVKRMSVKTPHAGQRVGMLSGGNQQKVVIGKWVARSPSIFLLDEPTRGIDVRSKSEIYALIDRLASEGAAVLVVSSDLEEVLRISDRVVVMHEGRLAGELSRDEMDEESVMQLATGNE